MKDVLLRNRCKGLSAVIITRARTTIRKIIYTLDAISASGVYNHRTPFVFVETNNPFIYYSDIRYHSKVSDFLMKYCNNMIYRINARYGFEVFQKPSTENRKQHNA